MLGLLLTLLIVVVALIVVLWVGTTFAQGFFYDSPVDGLAWRAPDQLARPPQPPRRQAISSRTKPNITQCCTPWSTLRITKILK